MSKRLFAFSLPILLLASTTMGQVTLVHKVTEGDTYKVKSTVSTEQKLTLAGQDLGTTSQSSLEQVTTVGKRGADGKLKLTLDNTILTTEISLPGGVKIKFDSKDKDPKETSGNPVAQIVFDKVKENAKTSTTLVLDKGNKVLDVEGLKPGADATPEAIKDEFAEQFQRFPDKPISKGDTWERDIKMNLGQGQVLAVKRKYTYEGETEKSTVDSTRKVHKITAVDTSALLTTRDGAAFKFSKSDLKVDDSTNTLLFDPQVGRAIEVNSKVRISGKLTLSINNMDLDGDLDLTLATKVEEIK